MSGATIVLSPLTRNPEPGDIVLAKVRGNLYVHEVKATRRTKEKTEYQIANHRGHVNGWTFCIYGIVTDIDNTTAS
jgi:SOS-response transcriptional repressor LexA